MKKVLQHRKTLALINRQILTHKVFIHSAHAICRKKAPKDFPVSESGGDESATNIVQSGIYAVLGKAQT